MAPPRVGGPGPREVILRLVHELPFAAGRSGLSRILAGASSAPIAPNRCRLFGALGGRTQVAIVAEIDGLRQEGLLVVSESGGRPCLVLTDAGRAALAS
jgi:hypothetical protein